MISIRHLGLLVLGVSTALTPACVVGATVQDTAALVAAAHDRLLPKLSDPIPP